MKYEIPGPVRLSETDEYGKLSLGALINRFQDCSTEQSEAIGAGPAHQISNGQAWILAYWQIDIHRLPGMGEKVTAATWAYEFSRFFGLRNFSLTAEGGSLLAGANSVWVFYDVRRGRPVNVPDWQAERYDPEEKLEMEYLPRKIHLPAEGIAREERFDGITVRRCHLDINHHVNNGQYVVMASEYLPDGFDVDRVRVEYRRQARRGEVLAARVLTMEDGRTIFVILEEEGESPYTLVEFHGQLRS